MERIGLIDRGKSRSLPFWEDREEHFEKPNALPVHMWCVGKDAHISLILEKD